jgi:hypothetical protein
MFLDSQLTDGGEVINLTRRPTDTPRKIPDTHFCQSLSRAQGHSAAGKIGSIKKSNDLIGYRTRDLPACSKGLFSGPVKLLTINKDFDS